MKNLLYLAFLLPVSAFADCTVAAFSDTANDPSQQPINVGLFPPAASERIVTNASTAVTPVDELSPIPAGTTYLLVQCDEPTYFSVGSSPVASSEDLWIPTDVWKYIGISTVTNTISLLEVS